MEQLGVVVPPLNAEVFRWLDGRGRRPAGPPFWKYNIIDMQRELEIEAGVTVVGSVEGDERVLCGVLPAGRYVTLRHVGHPSTLMDATASLLDWAAARGLVWDMQPSPTGNRWGARLEFYLTDPEEEPDMTRWVSELAFRLAD
jgi:hypothetical protein